ncbi:hypothetical protein [Bradyrhizobium commune]|uniref:Uncharacterized protein n=1 Tax=Bradyrhizobium commune TaxID=83627 RepID=A0A7S9CZV6_9BRAD|nr:hypothetical protein [Bradyrhizobium commune]QPF88607.1 hypothetical protein IC761_18885 [Bradyrhizobium commune]
MASATDWRKEKLASLLQAASHAISRARYVFLTSNVAGILILAGLFNSTFPWLRNAIDRAVTMSPQPPHLTHLQKVLYEDLWTLSVPLLGVKVSVDDLSVIGSSALLVIAIWQYYCVRRENHVIDVITKEAEKAESDKECRGYLYHGVAHYFVFTTRYFDDVTLNKQRAGATVALSILFFMPAWIPLLNVLSDCYTLFFPYKGSLTFVQTWDTLSTNERWEAVLRMFFAIVVGSFSLLYCVRCRELDGQTRVNVEKMRHLV